MDAEGELKVFVKIWISAILLLCYCHFIPNRIPHGVPRLLSLLPVILLFILLPLPLSAVHLAGPTVFYLLWLANFKLLLFAFNRPPLTSSFPLSVFLAVALLPINPKQATTDPDPDPDPNPSHKPLHLAIKALLLALIVRIYDYKQNLNPNFILVLYCLHVYFAVELVLAITAFFVRIFIGFGFQIEPQFDEPYLSTSLQDFWGRRWNLMVTRILRPTVYKPVRYVWGPLPAIVATFVASGLMHEVIYFYVTRVRPTWEVTWFFVLHGVCTAAEVAVKKAVGGRFRLHRAVSGPLTVGFVAVTAAWLFFPQLLRNGIDVKTVNEYSVMVDFFRSKITAF